MKRVASEIKHNQNFARIETGLLKILDANTLVLGEIIKFPKIYILVLISTREYWKFVGSEVLLDLF